MNDLALECSFNGREETLPAFTIEEFFAAKCSVVFTYRQAWAMVKWKIVSTNTPNRDWPEMDRDNPLISQTRNRWLKEAWGAKHLDNHQTFLVEIKNRLYFVTFSDGYIWIGDTARGSDY